MSDDKGRKTVVDLLPQVKERIYPVGRLDWDTTGVLLLTNDGDFSEEMVHPRNEIDKVYVARVKGIANKDVLRPLTRGVVIDGKKTKLSVYEILKVDPVKNRSVVQLTIHEGRNHQVKKMFEAVGFLVDKLSRTQFGNLDLTDLHVRVKPAVSTKKRLKRLHTWQYLRKNHETIFDMAGSPLPTLHFSPLSPFLPLSANLLGLHDSSLGEAWKQRFSDGYSPHLCCHPFVEGARSGARSF